MKMQLRRSILFAVCIILFIYFEIHSCSKDGPTAPETEGPAPELLNLICDASHAFFLDGRHGWVVGSGGTMITTGDGGETWSAIDPLKGSLNDVQFIDTRIGWVAGKDGALYKTKDGGATWAKSSFSIQPQDEDFYRISFINYSLGFLLGYHGVYGTDDGGATWKNNWLPVVPYRGAWGMSFIDGKIGYLLGSRWLDSDPVLIYKTEDGGKVWNEVPGSESSVLKTILTIEFVNNETGWAGGGSIMKTTDGGKTWATQMEEATVRSFHFLTSTEGIAVGGRTVLRTTDGGKTWDDVSPSDNRIMDLRDTFFLDSDTGWVVGRGAEEICGGKTYKHSFLILTRDGCESWSIIDFPFETTTLGAGENP